MRERPNATSQVGLPRWQPANLAGAIDDYLTEWREEARASRAIASIRNTHIDLMKREISALRAQFDGRAG